ncbi:MAG: HNH endonuclease [Clostridia bacterium]|nr:HNH endonuclease [Clostridia bacterium]
MCKCCLEEGAVTTEDLEAHHIVPIEEAYDLRLDDDNLITLCSIHHRLADSGRISRDHLRDLIFETTPRGDGKILRAGAARPPAYSRTHKTP